MRTIEGFFGECEIRDCQEGLPTLADQSYDLVFFDPYYNKNFGIGKLGHGAKQFEFYNKHFYFDDEPWEVYISKMQSILAELRRVAKLVIVHVKTDRFWEQNIAQADFTLTKRLKNPYFGGEFCKLRKRVPLICYGEPQRQFHTDEFDTLIIWGFLKPKGEPIFLHPCPMNHDFLLDLIPQSGAQSVLDPMCGTAAIGEACEILGIPWRGFEIDPEYVPDITRRVDRGMKTYSTAYETQTTKQATLW